MQLSGAAAAGAPPGGAFPFASGDRVLRCALSLRTVAL